MVRTEFEINIGGFQYPLEVERFFACLNYNLRCCLREVVYYALDITAENNK